MSREGSRQIEEKAALWAARLERGPLSAVDQTNLDGWLADDPRHLGAFARARAVALHSLRASALATSRPGGRLVVPEADFSRRRLLAASAAVVVVGASGLAAASWRRSQAYETGRGEVQAVTLSDGSVMTLSALSRTSVRYGREFREVVLTTGEALFNVTASDRPFLVTAGGMRILAASGRFLVRRMDLSPVQIMALEASVRILRDNGPPLSILPFRTAALSGGLVEPQPVGEIETARALAWREGRLAFQDALLTEVAAEFARFSDRLIVITDPMVRDMRITGLFPANDPVVFARAAAVSLNLRVAVASDTIRLSRW